jgi:hypothetical protein
MRRLEALLSIVLVAAATSCSEKPAPPSTESQATAAASGRALVEQLAKVSLSWEVAADGKTKLTVQSATGEKISDLSGKLEFAAVTTGEHKDVVLQRDPASSTLTGAGPALDTELTVMRYELGIGGEQAIGTLYLPRGGTAALADAAPEPAKGGDTAQPAAAPGPHGGQVEVAADGAYEIVADRDTGVVHVHALTRDLKPSAKSVTQIRIAIGGPEARVVTLKRIGADADAHFAGLLDVRAAGQPLTLVAKVEGTIHVSLIGLRRGQPSVLRAEATPPSWWQKKGWTDEADELKRDADNEHGGDGIPGDVTLCHVPPGNPGNQHTINVGASAVDAHLSHGDYRGPCKEGGAAGPDAAKDKDQGAGADKDKGKGQSGSADKDKGQGADKDQSKGQSGNADKDKGQSGGKHKGKGS